MQSRVLYHFAFWLGYLLFKTYLNFETLAYNQPKESYYRLFFLALGIQSIYLIVKIPLAYSILYFTGQFLSKRWGIIKTVSLTAIAFMVAIPGFLLLTYWVQKYILHHSMENESYLSAASFFYAFFLLGFTCGIALVFKLIRQNIKTRELAQELAKERLANELRFLKAQTNPHFLFNTLNNIYGLARKKSDDTAEVVLRLSKLLRFMLYETNKPFLPVEVELKIIEDYLELEKIRYNQRLKIGFSKTLDNLSIPIAPLILLPFIENAFKHGVGESIHDSFINIDIKLKNGYLFYQVENSKSEDVSVENNEKIGLINVSRQLELLYPEHRLTISRLPSSFKIVLEINLNSHATI
ncbi:sensor histidine kinase [Emticicia fluvialis]|uniref:sensor histidine kinase n=1 Tax=Emticicia fluvialis TaxID=2974474 RepID=UPI00216570A8|nr:sensor histidine kinase [Emticicia fluvialis]